MKGLLVKKGEDLSKIKLFKVESQHTSDDGSVVSFDFREQESEGTQRLLSLVLSCQIFFLPLSALIVPHWFVDFLSIRFCGLPFGY
jgi:hypothetical protein